MSFECWGIKPFHRSKTTDFVEDWRMKRISRNQNNNTNVFVEMLPNGTELKKRERKSVWQSDCANF
jgi:hypothetical protein